MSQMNSIAFRALMVLLGAINILLGSNVAFGGFVTLGWLGPTDFLAITNEAAYLVQDSHVRYFGGLYIGTGLFLLAAATNLKRFQQALYLLFFLIFMGGLARFSMMRPDVIFGPKIITSLVVELALMPIFCVWLSKILQDNRARP